MFELWGVTRGLLFEILPWAKEAFENQIPSEMYSILASFPPPTQNSNPHKKNIPDLPNTKFKKKSRMTP